MDTDFYSKVVNSNFQTILEKLNYVYFTNGDFNLNIIGVRKDNNNKVTNKYDDILVLEYKVNENQFRHFFKITTEPGDYYVRKHLCNPKGTAILVPGQYRGCWKLGKHNNKYEALVQCKPVKVYRDGNKDDIYDLNPDTVQEGLFGINIHRSNKTFTRNTIDMYSAGCQVFADPYEFNTFISLCKEQSKRYGNSFTYTLIDEKDLELYS